MSRRLIAVLFVVGAFAALAPAASAAPSWAPASSATIHPGVQTNTVGSGQCTSNFVYYDGSNNVYLGQAAHCSSTGAATETNGCDSASLPLGTKVDVDGASVQGTMVYNSWLAMQAAGETDAETCQYNDLALVRIDPADVGKVNPSIPKFGGPQGIGGTATGQQVYTYGNSSLRGGITVLSPKNGVTLQNTPGGWSHVVYTFTPGIPGDSGSAFLNASGQALGTLSTLNIAPTPLGNGVGNVGKELAYAQSHGFGGLTLSNGTEPFRASILGLT